MEVTVKKDLKTLKAKIMISLQEGIIMIIAYGIIMTTIVVISRKGFKSSSEEFLVANRKLGVWRGAISIAVSWIWAPAVFIVAEKAYTQGIPGVFWFTVPNILCFFIFAVIAVRVRKLIPEGYSFPDFLRLRYGSNAVHLASLLAYFGYQLGAIIINSVAGGILLSLLTGIPFTAAVLLMAGIALTYSLVSGLSASVLTDLMQMSLVLFIGIIIVPWIISASGGVESVNQGLGGYSGEFRDIFNPFVAFSFGIATTLGLISGPVADQMFYQRAFAVKRNVVAKTFVVGGLLFGVVPIILSFLGFIGASTPEVIETISQDPARNTQMVGPITVGYYLPNWALLGFAVLAFAALSSTLDSAFCAVSSLGSVDIYKKYFNFDAKPRQLLRAARVFMIVMAIIGVSIALLQPKLLWVFLIYGALASSMLFPAILSVFWKRLNAKGAFWAIILSLVIGTPLSIYANVKENVNLIVLSAVLSVVIGLIICLIFGLLNKKEYDFEDIKKK